VKTPLSAVYQCVLLSAIAVAAVPAVNAQDQTRVQTQTPIFGAQLMTNAERTAYRTKMRTLKTTAEKDAFRLEHHELMKVRAAEKGVTLPDAPMVGKGANAQTDTGAGQGASNGAAGNRAGGSAGK
jgi:negative regulator of sigma E activity